MVFLRKLSKMTWFWYILTAKRWTCALSEHLYHLVIAREWDKVCGITQV